MALHGNASAARPSLAAAAAPSLPQVHRVVGLRSQQQQQQQQPLLPRRSSPQEAVSLAQPRPDGERVANDYVEAPLRCDPAPPRPPSRAGHAQSTVPRQPARLPLPTAAKRPPPQHVVTKQPRKKSSAEAAECVSPAAAAAGDKPGICPECGECKCNACRGPKALPESWMCNNNVYCSPAATVDYVSCLCCVKAFFYHCSKDYERDDGNAPCADEPCSCAAPRVCARWACLAAISVLLPCLLCYWPLKACVAGYESVHNRLTSNRGCRCRPLSQPPLLPAAGNAPLPAAASNKALLDGSAADKRLLDSSPEC